jgi:Rod binding domain-containing protein
MELTAAQLANWNATQVRMELPRGSRDEQLRAVAVEFEALFAKQMLDAMQATLNPESDMFNGGMAEEIFRDMLNQEYSRMMAQEGSLGIADMIVEQLGTASGAESAAAAGRNVAAVYDSLSALP